ncbi:hypothetical protein CHARACLAT_022561 [Characodon lateralis]|uniref:Uncharacterized protein n=1 Tax=Characodon lateralis TaxID=208331 RepID=A0ABU7DTC4_9TELE|nr:hypothetical protein [Characodon lateralis]
MLISMVNLYRDRDSIPNNRRRAKRGAERLREYRKCFLRDDPVKYQEYLKKERERNNKRREEGKLKSVTELSARAQKHQRKEWRTREEKHRMMKEVAVCRDPAVPVRVRGKEGQKEQQSANT